MSVSCAYDTEVLVGNAAIEDADEEEMFEGRRSDTLTACGGPRREDGRSNGGGAVVEVDVYIVELRRRFE